MKAKLKGDGILQIFGHEPIHHAQLLSQEEYDRLVGLHPEVAQSFELIEEPQVKETSVKKQKDS